MASQAIPSVDASNTEQLLQIGEENVKILRGYYDDEAEWQNSKKTKEAVIDYKMSTSGDFQGKLYRGSCEVHYPFQSLFEYINPTLNGGALRLKWDKDISLLNVLKDVGEGVYLLRACTNSAAMGLISPRDFIDLLKIVKEEDRISINARSVVAEAFPAEENFVRGVNHPCGIVLKKHPENPNYTQVTTFVQSDIKGNIPKKIVDSALPGSMGGFFSNLKSILQKDKKWQD